MEISILFHFIALSSILFLIQKNIRDSLNHMAKYISNKQINLKKSNDIDNLKGINEIVWNLIASVYQLGLDSLYADNHLNSLRQKVASKFTPKVKPVINSNNIDKNKTVLASIEKLSHPIPAKSPKKVKKISKYFKNLKIAPVNKCLTKSYAQASKPVNHTKEIIRIKDTFLSLGASKINQVQKIIKGREKTKPYIKMTTKSLSRKQVIIPMNSDNIMRFIKESSLYISNLNRTLKNIKSDVLVDFIHLDPFGITVVTYKVASTSDLQVIENYVKSINCIDATSIKIPHLS